MGLISGKRPGGAASSWIRVATLGLIISTALQVAYCEEPTESQCRPYIEKALKQQHIELGETSDEESPTSIEKEESVPTDELTETIEDSTPGDKDDDDGDEDDVKSEETQPEGDDQDEAEDETKEDAEDDKDDAGPDADDDDDEKEGEEETGKTEEVTEDEGDEKEDEGDSTTEQDDDERDDDKEDDDEEETGEVKETETEEEGEKEDDAEGKEAEGEDDDDEEEDAEKGELEGEEKEKDEDEAEGEKEDEEQGDEDQKDETEATEEEATPEGEDDDKDDDDKDEEGKEEEDETTEDGVEESVEKKEVEEVEGKPDEEDDEDEKEQKEEEEDDDDDEKKLKIDVDVGEAPEVDRKERSTKEGEEEEEEEEAAEKEGAEKSDGESEGEEGEEGEEEEGEPSPEEDLTKEVEVPENLRPRDHITKILRLDEDSVETESALEKMIDSTLKNLKALYDNAIKPLEMLYKYRDLSNRHFGDPEIFSKPLILFMGPWSGGKSSTINYLLDNEFTEMSLRTGAEPSPAYFNILMYGEEEEVLDGTQLAADWTFSGLQKFGQSLLDRLKGYKLPSRLLQKVNIVEIPGILEIRKQVQRLFPFNDACQWFIDRADIIFLVYDPSKLDVGPETEAILDQLKGREYQTRIILNKADQVKPEELMRVQGTLIWNISPLMSSSEPPIMYTTSLWSLPYENGAPTRLLLAQERAFLRDLREAIDKRVDNKIASARRFAVRVRNHAKMVDCYLTTYYNHKTFFGNRKKISDDIIENPQKYHIYEGLSTLTNISRYDLPDPDVYKDFFKLNPLYDFKKLSDTCTYFRGCPINTLDVAIAYDLPELVGKYKKVVEASKAQTSPKTNS
ncbi:UNVERIFIED_CONTAM: hypothetical protein PYX00_006086 [Menopon gallinae]|uniref:Dynamin-type G domain-containing protein n=1 Tax=Menopon gallinae TaxID=328185 RepID=A0AAW2HUM2_9NEOP